MANKKINIQNVSIAVLILLGIIFRTRQYLSFRSFWLDEAMLALNIVNRSISGLLLPLDYNQGAPFGFLLIQKLIILVLGNRDYLFRLFPFAAGFASLFLMYLFARDYTQSIAVPIALSLFAFSEKLIYFSSEAKQYMIDVAAALFLFICFERSLRLSWNYRRAVIFGLIGALSMWFSFPALFILAGFFVSLTVYIAYLREWARAKYLLVSSMIWGISFIPLYFVTLTNLEADSFLLDFWEKKFMPIPPWKDLGWFVDPFRSLYVYLLSSENNLIILLAIALSVMGLFSLVRRKWVLGMAASLPIAITLLVSGFQKYPFWERLLLFLSPVIYLFIAEGIERIRLLLSTRLRYLSYILVVFLWIIVSFPSIAQAIHTYRIPNRREDFKHVMIHLQQNIKEGDQIYLFHFTFPAFKYYSTFYKIPTEAITYGSAAVGRKETYKYTEDLESLCNKYPNGRIWVVLTHARPFEFVVFKDFFKNHGTMLDKFLVQGSNLYLYKMHCNG